MVRRGDLRVVRPAPSGEDGANAGFISVPLLKTDSIQPSNGVQTSVGQVAPTANPLMQQVSTMPNADDLTDAKIAAAEARSDTKIARMEGKLDLVLSKLDDVREDSRSTRANQWVIGLGLAVLIVAIAALFPVFFSIGAQIRDMVHSEIKTQSPTRP